MRPVPDVTIHPLLKHPKFVLTARLGEPPVEMAHQYAFLQHPALPQLGDESVALANRPQFHGAISNPRKLPNLQRPHAIRLDGLFEEPACSRFKLRVRRRPPLS